MVCDQIEREGNSLRLRHGNYTIVSADVRSYKALYDGLASRDYFSLLDVLDEFDQHFRQNCTSLWLDIFDKALKSIAEKVEGVIGEPGVIGEFYSNLNNRLVAIADQFRAMIEHGRVVSEGVRPEERKQRLI